MRILFFWLPICMGMAVQRPTSIPTQNTQQLVHNLQMFGDDDVSQTIELYSSLSNREREELMEVAQGLLNGEFGEEFLHAIEEAPRALHNVSARIRDIYIEQGET